MLSMKRKYLKELEEWKNNKDKKPLIVWGARQVGKTYLIKDLFAENFFNNRYIYVDLKKDDEFRKHFSSICNADEIIDYLESRENIKIDENILLIFDEIQECQSILTSLKYFNQDHKNLNVIVTGSMVRIKLKRKNKENKRFLFPLGNIDELTIYQLNFEEFLMNANEKLYDYLINAYKNKIEISEAYHSLLLKYFYNYMMIGGMPAVVNKFLTKKSYYEALQEIKTIYNDYLDDMSLFNTSNETILKTKKVFKNIYKELITNSKNFSPSLIEKNTKNRDYENPINWLELAYLINLSYEIKEKITSPLINKNESIFRLYLSDTGLFTYQSEIKASSFILENDENTLSGIFYENYVASELINAGFPLYFWSGKNNAEFEFIIEDGNYFIPIDVKKNKGSLKSLEKFKDHNKFNYAIKISSSKYGYDKERKIYNIPFYEVFLFLKEIKENNNIDKIVEDINLFNI